MLTMTVTPTSLSRRSPAPTDYFSTVAERVFEGPETPGTLSLVLADLDGDHRLDVVRGQGEHAEAVREHIFLGTGLEPDTAPPVVGRPELVVSDAASSVRVRIHDRKTPPAPHDWHSVEARWHVAGETRLVQMDWYGENLWRSEVDGQAESVEICATDAAGNATCVAVPD